MADAKLRRFKSISIAKKEPAQVKSSPRPDEERVMENIDADDLSPSQRAQMGVYFRLFDEKGVGLFDCDTLKRKFRLLGLNYTDEELEGIFNGADVKQDGVIDFDEFKSLFVGSLDDVDGREREMRAAFARIDADGSDDLSVDELVLGLKELGLNVSRPLCEEMVSEIDEDGSRTINFGEFKRLISYISSRPELLGMDEEGEGEEEEKEESKVASA